MRKNLLKSPWTRRLGAAAGVYALFALVSLWGVPAAVRRALREVPKALPGFDARVADLSFDPLRLALTARGFAFSHEALGDLATCDETYASFQPLSLLRLAIGFRELRFTRPRLIATITPDGKSPLSYLPESPPSAAPAGPIALPFFVRLVVGRLEIIGGSLEFESRLPNLPQRMVVHPIQLELDNLSTLPNAEGAYQFAAKTNKGESFSWSGKVGLRPPRLAGSVDVKGLEASRLSTALPDLPAEVSDGALDAHTDYEMAYENGVVEATLPAARFLLRGVRWRPRGSSFEPRGPFTLSASPIRVELRAPLPSKRGDKATLAVDARLAREGALRLRARASMDPLAASGELRLSRLPLAPFSPLAPPPMTVEIDTGSLSVEARVAVSSRAADVRGEASLSLDGVALSVPGFRGALARLSRLSVEGARASAKDRSASVEKVTVEGPQLYLARAKGGLTNVEAALGVRFSSAAAEAPDAAEPAASTAPAKTPAARPAPAWRAKLKRFRASGGRVLVQDDLVAPPFSMALKGLAAELAGLSTDGRSTATFSAKGVVEGAPFGAEGTVWASSAALRLASTLKAEAIQLPVFTPYSIQMIAYKLDKGSMKLDLSQRLDGRRIMTRNRVVIDQLTLGDKVESPDALKIPVKLGLAILKDKDGVIDLDVPIEGDLDDPKMRLGRVILKTLVNLLIKAATSPFSVLGSMMGGGEDMSRVPFALGVGELSPQALPLLDKVAKALLDRPQMLLGVRGMAGREEALAIGDRELLRRLRGSKAGTAPLSPQEEAKVLEMDRAAGGPAGGAPGEARARVDERLSPKDADLRALALERAGVVHDQLVARGIAADRFFTLEPSAGAKAEGGAYCQLQLDLR